MFLKAARTIVKQSPEHIEEVRTQATKVMKAIEKECEKDKSMSNLKGKSKELKVLISSA